MKADLSSLYSLKPPAGHPVLGPDAMSGIPGLLVETIGPATEADPVAVLVQFLAAFGNAVGRGPYFQAEADRHYLNLFLALVGESSKGRKGTSLAYAKRLLVEADPSWEARNVSGLASGEGLIWAVRDAIYRKEPIKEGGRITSYQDALEDPGVEDKRLMIVEAEFARLLRTMGREGNTLSALIRQAWDSGNLQSMTKSFPAKATAAHTSIIAHGTRSEILRYLDATDVGNGFGNRFQWFCSRRSKCLPEGGQIPPTQLAYLSSRVRQALEHARTVGLMERDEEARALWIDVYPALSEGGFGMVGALTSRAEAQVMRLACLYALLDESSVIRAVDLRAALALWQYSEESCRYIFGNSLGDPMADEINGALVLAPFGMTRDQIRHHVGKNKPADQIEAALRHLSSMGLATYEKEPTAGRSVERWFSVRGGRKGREGREGPRDLDAVNPS